MSTSYYVISYYEFNSSYCHSKMNKNKLTKGMI